MKSVTYTQLLKENRFFRRLWAGQVISELGNWFNLIAELGLARMLSGSPLAATAVLTSRMAPFVLFAPFAGVIVDRFSRRKVMIAADLLRAVIALGYLLVRQPDQLWIAYLCGSALSAVTVFFEGARNAAMPKLTQPRELLVANALMYSTRFLQLTLGTAAGGLVSEQFGYEVAFLVNATSFVASAYFVWRIPEAAVNEPDAVPSGELTEATNSAAAMTRSDATLAGSVARFFGDIRTGWTFIWRTPLVLGIIGVNVTWATGGGAANLIYDRFGGQIYSTGTHGDIGVAVCYTAVGLGLVLGMFVARWIEIWLPREQGIFLFIGGALLLHGVLFAAGGLAAGLFGLAFCIFVSRAIIGAEFAIQETLLMRAIPDHLRGRVLTTDRSLELLMMTVSMIAAGYAFTVMPPRLIIIISGLLSASPGLFWLWAWRAGRLGRLPLSNSGSTRPLEPSRAEVSS